MNELMIEIIQPDDISFNTDKLDAKIPQHKINSLYDGMSWYYDVWAHFTEKKHKAEQWSLLKLKMA